MQLFRRFFIVLLCVPIGLHGENITNKSSPTKILIWPDGTRYVGETLKSKREGRGTIFWQDGTRFIGQFKNDRRDGPGTMIMPDGTVYSGFFKNDELVTKKNTGADNKLSHYELDSDASSAALKGTNLSIEADSLVRNISMEPVYSDEDKLSDPSSDQGPLTSDLDKRKIEEKFVKRISTDTMVNSISSTEKIGDVNNSETKITSESISTPEPGLISKTGKSPDDLEITNITAETKKGLINTINLWAEAWSDQEVSQYLIMYSEEFNVPGDQKRRSWETLRDRRIRRPNYIKIEIEYERFELVKTNIVDVFFRQVYRSNTYNDITDKVLRMHYEGADWKILAERSR